MNKIIFSKKIVSKLTSITGDEDKAMAVFDDKTIEFATVHDQDCCEHVYADFSILVFHKKHLEGKQIETIKIKAVKKIGFMLCFGFEYDNPENVLIPCHNNQNGYYSDDLTLSIKIGEGTTIINLNTCEVVPECSG